MCVIEAGATITAAQALTANIAIASIGASVAMSAVSMQAQAAATQQQMNLQAQQAQRQQEMQRQSMMLQQDQQRQTLILQQKTQQDQYNLSIQQANTQIANQYQQQNARVRQERENLAKEFEQRKQAYQQDKESAEQQQRFNNEAANRMYVQEQSKLSEAKKKQAFAQQSALAKMIGSKGAILSAGRTGQSVGLLVNDAERQAGFQRAQASALLDSKKDQAFLGMETAFIQAQSANQRAVDSVGIAPIAPYMPDMPDVPNFVDPYRDEPFNV